MRRSRIFIAQSAEFQLKRLPQDSRLHIETHLENLVLVLEQDAPEAVLARLPREDEGFTTNVGGVRIYFSVDTSLRALTVQRLEVLEPPRRDEPTG
ncbi:hypothetical protein [Pyxidicoccus xibeiensis]|uniref:hypothetical protein n=1 Tax=Pyxidicoccus xibeiensis TaxID=2906759 RepID=UPI0020A6EC93|nr:hypothetical protein [Pyxidicoccus xibeiensis]MCP3139775.1 hypothetical protein [Pyxidicoccus xibeiensis]